jgi:hypothetical protein
LSVGTPIWDESDDNEGTDKKVEDELPFLDDRCVERVHAVRDQTTDDLGRPYGRVPDTSSGRLLLPLRPLRVSAASTYREGREEEEGKSTDLVYHEPVTAERIGTIALSLIPSRTRQTQSSMKLVQAPVQVRTSWERIERTSQAEVEMDGLDRERRRTPQTTRTTVRCSLKGKRRSKYAATGCQSKYPSCHRECRRGIQSDQQSGEM